MPAWLETLGLPAPAEERVRVGIGYTTVIIRRRPHHLDGDHGLLVAALPPNRRSGVAVAVEEDRLSITLSGHLGDHPPGDLPGLLEWALGSAGPGATIFCGTRRCWCRR